MKKRLLITSIVMMLVVAVALSTATYAWFTSNTTVTVNSLTLTAATMDADAIMISKTANNEGLTNVVDFTTQSGTLYPSTPNAATALTAPAAASFANLEVNGKGEAKVKALPSNTASYYTDTVYVYNKGSKAVTLDGTAISIAYANVAANVEAAASVRIALIERIGSSTPNSTSTATLASATLVGIYEIDEITPVYQTPNDSSTDIVSYTATTKLSSETDTYGITGSGETKTKNTELMFDGTGFHAINSVLSGNYICNAYTVVMWLEGWDAQCTNAASAGVFEVGLVFEQDND